LLKALVEGVERFWSDGLHFEVVAGPSKAREVHPVTPKKMNPSATSPFHLNAHLPAIPSPAFVSRLIGYNC
jgi:hypothetical protein